ncbi:MAG: hypothetical protein JSV63_00700 [Candidatus Aenigmatarchaeota archaeon]|nr:MAG: hypothetical protein JSV63_00700 [Candidatus Aenigmarchaeota archaeon]
MSRGSRAKWMFNEVGGLYLQFLIILALMVIFAFFLNSIFSIDDNELRIIFSSFFLAGFTGIIAVFRKI